MNLALVTKMDIHSTLPYKNFEIFTLDMGEIGVGNIYYRPFNFVWSHPAPAILYTSKEAWGVGLKHYQLLFGTDFRLAANVKVITSHFEGPTTDLMAAQRSWVDKDIDEVVLYHSSDWISRDRIRFVELDKKKMEARERVELKSALKMMETVMAKLQIADREHGVELRRPVIKLVCMEAISNV